MAKDNNFILYGIHFSISEIGGQYLAARTDSHNDFIGTVGWYKSMKNAIRGCNNYCKKEQKAIQELARINQRYL